MGLKRTQIMNNRMIAQVSKIIRIGRAVKVRQVDCEHVGNGRDFGNRIIPELIIPPLNARLLENPAQIRYPCEPGRGEGNELHRDTIENEQASEQRPMAAAETVPRNGDFLAGSDGDTRERKDYRVERLHAHVTAAVDHAKARPYRETPDEVFCSHSCGLLEPRGQNTALNAIRFSDRVSNFPRRRMRESRAV